MDYNYTFIIWNVHVHHGCYTKLLLQFVLMLTGTRHTIIHGFNYIILLIQYGWHWHIRIVT